MLAVDNLETGYGQVKILRGISFQLRKGERIGLFGPNGHGKTTLLQAISGLVPLWAGSVTFGERVISRARPWEIVKLGLIQVPQGNLLFPRMTVTENLLLGGYCNWRERNRRLEQVFTLFPRLFQRRRQLCRTLSGGERQMLAIGAGLMADAEVLMVDEPTLGLAPHIKDELLDAIITIGKQGLSLIVVEQDLEFLKDAVDRLFLLHEGRMMESSDFGRLDRSQLVELYFQTMPGV